MHWKIDDDEKLLSSVRDIAEESSDLRDREIESAIDRSKTVLVVDAGVDESDFYKDDDALASLLYLSCLTVADAAREDADVIRGGYSPLDERYSCTDVSRATEGRYRLWHDSICEACNAYLYSPEERSMPMSPMTPFP
ncbi:hypothetical protein [Haladaptatus sp. CMAA 1911]|uniref:hypothetical protein n=1 Tax=unclassified Haladaptatus TaxID=2622732 RepID=UPI0037544DDA